MFLALLGVFVLGMLGMQQSFAFDYVLSNDGNCGGLVPDIAEWDSLTNTCRLIDDFAVGDGIEESLTVNNGVTFEISDGFAFDNIDATSEILGTLVNNGEMYNDGDLEVSGTLVNNGLFENTGELSGNGIFENTSSEMKNFGAIVVHGTFTNTGTLDNKEGEIYLQDDGASQLINDGTFVNRVFFYIGGIFTNNNDYVSDIGASITLSSDGVFDNLGTVFLDDSTITTVNGLIHIQDVDGVSFVNSGKMVVESTGEINIESPRTLQNDPADPIIEEPSDSVGIDNYCGLISNAITGDQPLDMCPPKVTITHPIESSPKQKFGNVLPVQLVANATDQNNFGILVNVTSDITWAIKKGSTTTPLVDVGGVVSHIFTSNGEYTIIATIDDPVDPDTIVIPVLSDTDQVNIEILPDNDGDGFVNSKDCDDSDPNVYFGAPERINGIDDDCDGLLITDEQDSDLDNYILGLFTPDDWLAVPVPTGGSDCDDTNPAVNPGTTEIFGDGVDNNCDGFVDEGFTDADEDGFVIDNGNVLPDYVDCDDSDALINPNATEVFDGVDNNCDGFVDEGFTDADEDGYDLTNDCDDTQASVNPGADELGVIDGVDTDCNPVTTNPDEQDSDLDNYILGLFTPDDWLAVPVPTGGSDCDDTNPAVNPGATEVYNGIDDDCDGTIDFGLDDDGDGYFTGNILGVSDCLDRPVTDPNNDYYGIDPFLIHPGAVEIVGDGIDNNCDDIIDEEKTILPELQGDLTNKQIKKFERMVKIWNKQIDRLDKQIEKLNEKADKEDAKGHTEKADKYRAEAESNTDEIQVLEDEIAVIEMSIGNISIAEVPIHFQDKLSDKDVKKIEKQIKITEKKIQILNHLADKFDEKAQKEADKGKQDKADKLFAKADSLRAEAAVYEDLNQVLICAIDYHPIEKVDDKKEIHIEYDDEE